MDYGLCDQTATIYHKEKDTVVRTLVKNCYWECRREKVSDVYGTRMENKFLLILPGTHPIYPGDRVFFGIGPEVSLEEWSNFIPAKYIRVGEAEYVTPFYREGVLCHTEAGRK